MTARTNRRVRCASRALAVLVACCGLAQFAQAQAPNKKQIIHNETLTGSGTVAMPLKLAVPLILNGSTNNAVIAAENASTSGLGVQGIGNFAGLYGYSAEGSGVRATSNTGYGVYASSNTGYGVYASSNTGPGVYGKSTRGNGVFGSSDDGFGVAGISKNNSGVYGVSNSSSSYAGNFIGNVQVTGTLSKSGGSFKIDHPLDPANKYLSHSFVESPDMMNLYNGNAVLDATGEAVVELPEWFGALNKDFRYQLTCIGGFAPIYVAEEITNNRFTIAGGAAGMKVSWQVTGVRQDAWATKHRIPIEEDKAEVERGHYLHPELFDQPEEKGIEWARHPTIMKQMKEAREPRPIGTEELP
jgi:trimeric autotransporter adhesin